MFQKYGTFNFGYQIWFFGPYICANSSLGGTTRNHLKEWLKNQE